jgi:hypothetical protein
VYGSFPRRSDPNRKYGLPIRMNGRRLPNDFQLIPHREFWLFAFPVLLIPIKPLLNFPKFMRKPKHGSLKIYKNTLSGKTPVGEKRFLALQKQLEPREIVQIADIDTLAIWNQAPDFRPKFAPGFKRRSLEKA